VARRGGTKSSRNVRPPGWKLTALETSRVASPGCPSAGTFVSQAGDRQRSMFPVSRQRQVVSQGRLYSTSSPHLQLGLLCHGGQAFPEPTPIPSMAAGPMECWLLPSLVGYFGIWLDQGGAALSVGGGGVLGHTLTRALDPTLQQHRQKGAGGSQNAQGHLCPRATSREEEHCKAHQGLPLLPSAHRPPPPPLPPPLGPRLFLGSR
jgi:hypothetical protein